MKKALRLAFSVSRPRFWAYLAGPYLVGYTAGQAGGGAFPDFRFWVTLAYFTLPANLFLYGLNDLSDTDTDTFNPKKEEKECRLTGHDRRPVMRWVIWAAALGAGAAALQANWPARAALIAFLVLSVAYSMPPARLKARPLLDSVSNVLYACPMLAGYAHSSGMLPPPAVIAAAWLWTAAMHLYSAIPDIASDTAASVSTSAVALGYRGSLLACAFLWGACCLVVWTGGILAPYSYLAAVYPAVPLWLALAGGEGSAAKAYWYFPALNTLAGFIVFLLLVT